MKETIKEILSYCEAHANNRMASQIKNKGATEETIWGTPQKDLKKLYKKYVDNHELALELYKLDNLEARSLATMIADLGKMDEKQFNEWIELSDSFWLNNYQLSVTLAGHKDAQRIAMNWIKSDISKKVDAGFFTYCWLLGNRQDSQFTDEEIGALLSLVESSENLSEGMKYFVEVVGISYIPLHDQAVKLAKERNIKTATMGIEKAKEKGRLGFKRNYLRC